MKKNKKMNAARRGSWGNISPITKIIPNKKHMSKAKRMDKEIQETNI